MNIRFCATCGKRFKARRNQWFCTFACKQEAKAIHRKRGLPLRNCVICGKTFQPTEYSPAETCSLRCHDRLPFSYPSAKMIYVERVIVKQKECKNCGGIFESTASAQAFCSKHCKDEFIQKTLGSAHYQVNTCVACGEDFYALDDNDVCCSQACEKALNQINSKGNILHDCYFCGKLFLDGTKQAKRTRFFCSKECYRKYRNVRNALCDKEITPKKHKAKHDGLAETNAKARALGLSYGQYQYLKMLGKL